jgi:hypothetical protein
MAPLCKCSGEETPRRIRSTGLVPKYETGQVSSEHFFEEISAVLDLKITYDQFRGLPERRTDPRVDGDCSPRPVPITAALQHESDPLFDDLGELPGAAPFRSPRCSLTKSALRNPTLKSIGSRIKSAACAPKECFFTDDIQVNVDAARQEGIDAVLFTSAEQTKSELRARGVEL